MNAFFELSNLVKSNNKLILSAGGVGGEGREERSRSEQLLCLTGGSALGPGAGGGLSLGPVHALHLDYRKHHRCAVSPALPLMDPTGAPGAAETSRHHTPHLHGGGA